MRSVKRSFSTRISESTAKPHGCVICGIDGRIGWRRIRSGKILHSADPAQSCGIGFLSFQGADFQKIHDALWTKTTQHRDCCGGARGILRIAHHAAVYSTLRDIDYFAEMVEKELKSA